MAKYIKVNGLIYRMVDEWSEDARAFFSYLKSVKQTLNSLFRGVLVDIENMDRVFKGLNSPSILLEWSKVKAEFNLLSSQEKLILRESTQLLRKQAEFSRAERVLHNDSVPPIEEFRRSLSLVHKCNASIEKMKNLTSFKHHVWSGYWKMRTSGSSFYRETEEFQKGMENLNKRFDELHHLLYKLSDAISTEMKLLNVKPEGRSVGKPNLQNYQTKSGLWRSRGQGYQEYKKRQEAFEKQSEW